MLKNTTLFSIIIPHRGAPELLQRLLGSIPQREDMEVIVVEDIEGRGAGWARNQGLQKAKGEYLLFADSDDTFLPGFSDFLDKVKHDIESCENEAWDLAFFSATSKEEDTDEPSWRTARLNWIMEREPSEREFLLRHTFTEPWCHIVKRSLIDSFGIRFDETPILNDVHFSTQAGYHARRIRVFKDKAYCVTNRKGSVGKIRDKARYLAYTRVMAETNIFNRTHGIDRFHARMIRPVMENMIKFRLTTALQCLSIIHNTGFSYSDILLMIVKYPFHLVQWGYRHQKYSAYK